jgi:hypothetical protein
MTQPSEVMRPPPNAAVTNVNRRAIGVEPTGIFPAGSNNNVSASLKERRYLVRLHISAISKANFALDRGYPVKPLGAMFIGQFKVTKAFGRQIESAMNTPQPIFCLGRSASLKDRRGVDDADDAALARLRRR